MPNNKVRCFGGPKDGAWSMFYGDTLRIPKPIDYSSKFVPGEGMVPCMTISNKDWVYRLVEDPIRGKAYIFDGEE